MKRILFISAIVLLGSCQKAQRDEDTSVNTCVDISLAQTIFADASKQIRIAALNTKGISSAETTLTTIYGCEEITTDTSVNPMSMVIDYKYIGCQGMGVDRYGRLLAAFYGKFGEEGSAIDITFTNYFFREYEVNGKIRIIFKEPNAGDEEVHSFYLQNGSVFDGSNTLSWTSSQIWTVTAKPGKPEQYLITGNSNGINRKGNTFKSEIISDNLMTEDCLYVTSGSVKIEIQNLSLRTLYYGSGTCDRNAEATINGASFPVTIP